MADKNQNKWTSITVQRTDIRMLDSYAESTFGTDDVSYRAILQNLLSEAGYHE